MILPRHYAAIANGKASEMQQFMSPRSANSPNNQTQHNPAMFATYQMPAFVPDSIYSDFAQTHQQGCAGQMTSGFLDHQVIPNFRHLDTHQNQPLVHRSRGKHIHQHRLAQLQHHSARPYPVMTFQQPQMSDDDLAEMQKLSNNYEPDITGPLVAARQSTSAITKEYASADPVYQQKTVSLPGKYPHYRTVRGDGRCGWRAVGFSFFERLVLGQDPDRFGVEEARLRSLHNIINAAGFEPLIYEDFADEVYSLLRALSNAVRNGNGESVLLSSFNNDEIESAIITHLRLLTAAWMKTHIEDYINFTPSMDVEEYCNSTIMPVATEIDHLGLSALNDVLLAPASMGLIVVYLDRSVGPNIDQHSFVKEDQLPPTTSITLLYRPGHYDILYKAQDITSPSLYQTPSVAVYHTSLRGQSFDQLPQITPINIPGLSKLLPGQHYMSRDVGYTGSTDFANPTPAYPSLPQAPVQHAQELFSQPAPSFVQSTAMLPPTSLPQEIFQSDPTQHDPHHQQLAEPQGPSIRPSRWVAQLDHVSASAPIPPFQTAVFRDSPHNPAHFCNPDFHPSEWNYENDYTTTSTTSKRAKKG